MNKLEVLKTALTGREEEIAGYQLNIDNYVLAIKQIQEQNTTDSDVDVALRQFAEQLQKLLSEHIIEKAKTKVLYDVIKAQVQELESTTI